MKFGRLSAIEPSWQNAVFRSGSSPNERQSKAVSTKMVRCSSRRPLVKRESPRFLPGLFGVYPDSVPHSAMRKKGVLDNFLLRSRGHTILIMWRNRGRVLWTDPPPCLPPASTAGGAVRFSRPRLPFQSGTSAIKSSKCVTLELPRNQLILCMFHNLINQLTGRQSTKT